MNASVEINFFRFSLIITSQDRFLELDRFFNSLKNQNYRKDRIQIIFVNQGLYKIDKGILSDYKYEVFYTDRIPLSKARNIGLMMARGEIIAFPDDDCWYENFFFEKIDNFFKKNTTIDCLCTNVYDPEKNLIYGQRPLNKEVIIEYRNIFQLPISVGLFIKKQALVQAGYYFDQNLGAGTKIGSGEETELIIRLLESKAKIVYYGYISVYHPVYSYEESDIMKSYRYGIGFGYLVRKLIKKKRCSIVHYFFYILLRTTGGIFYNIKSKIYFKVYVSRFKGILKGFFIKDEHSL